MKKRNLIGENLKRIRLSKGLSQEEFIFILHSLGLQLDRSSLSRIERYKREVYDYELVYFSIALDVDLKLLLENPDFI